MGKVKLPFMEVSYPLPLRNIPEEDDMRKMRHFKFLLGISLIGTYLSALPGCVSIPVAGVVQVDHKAQTLSLYKAGKSLKLAEITAESAVDLGIIQKGSLVALAVADALDKAKTSYDLA
ncbi:hypothetical protein, partial [Parvimonas sp. M20]|uniref:hypothetical protein n=1 Tax=Parvimonas sp. M20 TaxID=3110693 RepID=UPI002B48DCDB